MSATVQGVALRFGEPPAEASPPAERGLPSLDRKLLCAAREALAESGTLDPQTALVLGTSFGSLRSTTDFLEGVASRGPGFGSPTAFTQSLHHAPAGRISIALGLRGLSLTVSNRELSGEGALRTALLLLETQRARAVLVVGGDEQAPMLDTGYAAFGQCWPEREGVAALWLTREPGPLQLSAVHLRAHPCGVLDLPTRAQLAPLLEQVSRAGEVQGYSLAASSEALESDEEALLQSLLPGATRWRDERPVAGGLARVVGALRQLQAAAPGARRGLVHGVALGGAQAVTVVERVG